MIVDCLDCGKGEEENGSSRRHPGRKKRQGAAKCVNKKPLQRMIVQSSESVGHHEPVMLRVDVLVQPLILMHKTVHKVLPSVQNEHGNEQLFRQNNKSSSSSSLVIKSSICTIPSSDLRINSKK
ncbi:hypothetical protein TorRG33x02_166950 [Trema orientale]|uniref:Uncharacterized protein n=1 Tax=Trema orientale TaxID=63057 RepID=A0A2P5EPP6_TREOI|nr:hypothetical protein TorRG33x02_166950 [Trema orientale]